MKTDYNGFGRSIRLHFNDATIRESQVFNLPLIFFRSDMSAFQPDFQVN